MLGGSVAREADVLSDRSPAPGGRPSLLSAGEKMQLLRAVDILQDLSAEDRAWLHEVMPAVTFEPGEMIYGRHGRNEVLFILKRGRVQLYDLSARGKKLEVTTQALHLVSEQRLTAIYSV
jgi:hypothetical protein